MKRLILFPAIAVIAGMAFAQASPDRKPCPSAAIADCGRVKAHQLIRGDESLARAAVAIAMAHATAPAQAPGVIPAAGDCNCPKDDCTCPPGECKCDDETQACHKSRAIALPPPQQPAAVKPVAAPVVAPVAPPVVQYYQAAPVCNGPSCQPQATFRFFGRR